MRMTRMKCEGCGEIKDDVMDYMIPTRPYSFAGILTVYLCKECNNKAYDDLVVIAIRATHNRMEKWAKET